MNVDVLTCQDDILVSEYTVSGLKELLDGKWKEHLDSSLIVWVHKSSAFVSCCIVDLLQTSELSKMI